jgi:hypothetical protein
MTEAKEPFIRTKLNGIFIRLIRKGGRGIPKMKNRG